MTKPGERMMIAFFQTLFVFGHRPWKVADPKTDDHMGVGAFNMVRRSAYESVGTYERLRMKFGRHETWQGDKEGRVRPTQCLWRRFDLCSLG